MKIRIVDEPGTLFYIVHDEGKELIRRLIIIIFNSYFVAHYNALKDRIVDKFLNDPVVARAENVVILQVTATPYNLLTKNSR